MSTASFSANLTAMVVFFGLTWLWGKSMRDREQIAVEQQEINMKIGNPSAEAEVDPTRWRHDGAQPLQQFEGNRRPVPSEPHTEKLLISVNKQSGVTPTLPPTVVTQHRPPSPQQHTTKAEEWWFTPRYETRTPHPEVPLAAGVSN